MDAPHATPDEPDHQPDYRESRWLRFGGGPTYWGDPVTLALFTEALSFLDSLTGQFNEFGPWPLLAPIDLMEALYQHNQQAQAEGRLDEGEEVTLIHVLTLSRRRLQAFEETGWNLTHYDDLVRFVDGIITQTLAGMMSENNPGLTYAVLLASLPPEDRLEEDDPNYPDYEADSGCRTCASGQPCWMRTQEDIHDILAEAHLPATEALACLEWMLEEGRSTLTHSIIQMVQAFASVQANHTIAADPSPVDAADANLRQDAASQRHESPQIS
jgi:hypothetical protein